MTSTQAGISLGSVPVPLASDVSQPGLGARGPGCGKSCCVLCTGVPPHYCDWCPRVTKTERGPLRFQAEAHSQFAKVQCTVPKVFPQSLARGALEGGRGDDTYLPDGSGAPR